MLGEDWRAMKAMLRVGVFVLPLTSCTELEMKDILKKAKTHHEVEVCFSVVEPKVRTK